jgi:hypothetical protein
VGELGESPNRTPPPTVKPSPPPPPAPTKLSAADSIEDAILAALDVAAIASTTTTKRPPRRRKVTPPPRVAPPQRQNGAGVILQAEPSSPLLESHSPAIPPNYVLMTPEELAALQLQMQMQMQGGGSTMSTTTPATPGEYLAGFFGSLASANLIGMVDNTFKLLGSESVQGFLMGLADQVTCQLGQNCNNTVKRQKTYSERVERNSTSLHDDKNYSELEERNSTSLKGFYNDLKKMEK